MKLTLIRHLKVNFSYKPFYTSRGFDQACDEYNACDIVFQKNTTELKGRLYISSLKRTRSTAVAHNRVEEIHSTELLDEVPLRSFMYCPIPIPTVMWMIVGRLQWWFNCRRQSETRNETAIRMNRFINLVEKEKQDCIVIGHGFYFWHMSRLLLERGYKGRIAKRLKNGESVEFEAV